MLMKSPVQRTPTPNWRTARRTKWGIAVTLCLSNTTFCLCEHLRLHNCTSTGPHAPRVMSLASALLYADNTFYILVLFHFDFREDYRRCTGGSGKQTRL